MSNWKTLSFILAGLLLLSCLGLAGIGAWWIASGGGGKVLAAMTGRTLTGVPTATPTATSAAPVAGPNPSVGRARGLPAVGIFGIVTAANDSSLTVSGPRGAVRTLAIGNQTRLIVVGVTNPTLADVKPGDKVTVLGLKRSANSLEPRVVIAAPSDYTRVNVRVGRLESMSGQSLALRTRGGALTVTLDSSTQIYNQTLQTAQEEDLTAGSTMIVIGQPKGDGTFDAQLVLARIGGPGLRQQRVVPGNPTPTPSP